MGTFKLTTSVIVLASVMLLLEWLALRNHTVFRQPQAWFLLFCNVLLIFAIKRFRTWRSQRR